MASAADIRRPEAGRAEHLDRILNVLSSGRSDVEGSALVSADGLLVASALPAHLDEADVADSSATLLRVGLGDCRELARGEIREVVSRGELGYAVLVAAKHETALLCLAHPEAKLGALLIDMRRAVEDIERIL